VGKSTIRGRIVQIEMTAEVVGAYTFKANGQDVTKVTVLGNQGGPMGNGIECTPYGIFELDAEMAVSGLWLSFKGHQLSDSGPT